MVVRPACMRVALHLIIKAQVRDHFRIVNCKYIQVVLAKPLSESHFRTLFPLSGFEMSSRLMSECWAWPGFFSMVLKRLFMKLPII